MLEQIQAKEGGNIAVQRLSVFFGILAWNVARDFIGASFSSFLYAKLSKHQNQSDEAENRKASLFCVLF